MRYNLSQSSADNELMVPRGHRRSYIARANGLLDPRCS